MKRSPLEDRLARTFEVMASVIEDVPGGVASFEAWDAGKTESRRLFRRHIALATGVVGGLAVAGTGLAAAAGAFNAQADQEFRHEAANAPFTSPSSQSSTTVLFDPSKETLEATSPGPEGTSVSVWTYQSSPSVVCMAIVETDTGQPTAPGKAAGAGGGGCSGAATNSAVPPNGLYGESSTIWESSSGAQYMLAAGNAPAGANKVVLNLADGTSVSPAVSNGWFVLALPYAEWMGGYTGVFYNSAGQQLPAKAYGGYQRTAIAGGATERAIGQSSPGGRKLIVDPSNGEVISSAG